MQFENFSNFEVTQAIDKVFKSERQCQVSFILLLNEVYKRSLYLEAGFSSTLSYCVGKFGLSEHSAYKRIQLSKIAAKFPAILETLKEKKLSLTTASLIAPKLKNETHLEQMAQCFGKSKDEVKRIMVGWEPRADVTDLIRHYKTPIIQESQPEVVKENMAQAILWNQTQTFAKFQQFDLIKEIDSDTKRKVPELIPLSVERTCLRFSIDTKTEEKLKRAKEICNVRGLEELLNLALEALLEKKDPQRREERRAQNVII